MNISIGVIEDDLELASAMERLLNESEGFQCDAVFYNADDAIKNIPKLQLDIVLTDIYLGEKNGIDCIIALKSVCKETEFLVCTSYEDTEMVFKALEAGAVGYLVKTIQPSILLNAINDAFNGGAPMSSQIARKVVQSFYSVQKVQELDKLSYREQEILNFLTQGYRYKEIAGKLFISITTVKKHIYNIYQKLQVNSKLEAINKVYKNR